MMVMRHWQYVVAQDKLDRQLQGLRLFMQRKRLEYFGVFPVQRRDPEQREVIRQLEIEIAKCLLAKEEIAEFTKRNLPIKHTWWDDLIIRAYNWSVYNR